MILEEETVGSPPTSTETVFKVLLLIRVAVGCLLDSNGTNLFQFFILGVDRIRAALSGELVSSR